MGFGSGFGLVLGSWVKCQVSRVTVTVIVTVAVVVAVTVTITVRMKSRRQWEGGGTVTIKVRIKSRRQWGHCIFSSVHAVSLR